MLLLSQEQGGLMTFSCKVAFFRKPRRLLSIPEVAFPEADILASLIGQKKVSYWTAWAGELGHFLWRKLQKNFFLYAVSIFSKVIAQAFWPMVILQFPVCSDFTSLSIKSVFFSDREHWFLVFVIMNTCQTLLSVFLDSILCALLLYLISARMSLSLREIFFNVLDLVSSAVQVLQNRMEKASWVARLSRTGHPGE